MPGYIVKVLQRFAPTITTGANSPSIYSHTHMVLRFKHPQLTIVLPSQHLPKLGCRNSSLLPCNMREALISQNCWQWHFLHHQKHTPLKMFCKLLAASWRTVHGTPIILCYTAHVTWYYTYSPMPHICPDLVRGQLLGEYFTSVKKISLLTPMVPSMRSAPSFLPSSHQRSKRNMLRCSSKDRKVDVFDIRSKLSAPKALTWSATRFETEFDIITFKSHGAQEQTILLISLPNHYQYTLIALSCRC